MPGRTDRPFAGLAAVRRTLGPALDGRCRFGEDNPTSEATNPAYPFAWRYRDWIIDAVNRDVPYDRFIKLQLAADLMPGTPRDDMRALGYLGQRRSITRISACPWT